MKKIFALALALLLTLSFAACTPQNTGSSPSGSYSAVDINVGGIKGPTAVGMVSLMQKAEDNTAENNYTFSVHSVPNELVGKVMTGDVDIAAMPTNLASTLYKKSGGKVKILAVNTYGVLSILENGETVNSIEDLRGKTVYSTGEGSNPEYILKHVLEENGIDPENDLTIEFLGSNEELVQKMVKGEVKIAMVPEPAATTVMSKVSTIRRVLFMDSEWEKVSPDSALMMGCVVVRTEFLENNPAAVEKFMQEYKASVEAVADTERTAELCEKFEIIDNKAIAAAAIPNCHIGFVSGELMKTKLGGYFDVLFEADPTSIGGALPDDNFYYLP